MIRFVLDCSLGRQALRETLILGRKQGLTAYDAALRCQVELFNPDAIIG